jgi:hypothetical protein
VSSPTNKNKKTSGGKTNDHHKLVYNMTTAADNTARDKNVGGDEVDAKTGGDDDHNGNTDADDETTKTGSNADDNSIGGSYGEAKKKEEDSYDAEVVLDPASQAALLSEYDEQWPNTPFDPPSSKRSKTGDDSSVDDNDDAVDHRKEDSMNDVEDNVNEEDEHDPNKQNKYERDDAPNDENEDEDEDESKVGNIDGVLNEEEAVDE